MENRGKFTHLRAQISWLRVQKAEVFYILHVLVVTGATVFKCSLFTSCLPAKVGMNGWGRGKMASWKLDRVLVSASQSLLSWAVTALSSASKAALETVSLVS